MSVAIVGGTGNLGRYIVAACLSKPFRDSFPSVFVVTRSRSTEPAQALERQGATLLEIPLEGAAFSTSKLTEAFREADVRVVVDVQAEGPGGHLNKDVVLEAAANSGTVKALFLGEYGIDHRVLEFSHPEWDDKKVREKKARSDGRLQIISLYIGLFLQEVFSWPHMRFKTEARHWELINSAESRLTLTSKADVGLSVASLASLVAKGKGDTIPTHVRVQGVSTTLPEAARLFSEADKEHDPIKIEVEPLEPYKSDMIKDRDAHPPYFLRFLAGEGKIDFSSQHHDELVNPGQKHWEWQTVEEFATRTRGRAWCSDMPPESFLSPEAEVSLRVEKRHA